MRPFRAFLLLSVESPVRFRFDLRSRAVILSNMSSAPEMKTGHASRSGTESGPPAFQERWLVRTAKNQILGPWSRDDLRKKILSGELEAQDEVCRANTYWIFLHESEELYSALSVRLPPVHGADVTEPGVTADTVNPAPPAAPQLQVYREEENDGGTSMISGHGAPSVAPSAESNLRRVPQQQPRIQVLGKIEKPSLWRGVGWILLTSALIIIYFVLRALRTGAIHRTF